MTNIFLINSPFQLLCAIEVISAFNCQNNVLVVFNKGKGETFNQISIVLEKYRSRFNHVEIIDRELESVSGWLDGFKKMEKLVNHYPVVKRVFAGDYRSGLVRHFTNSVKSKEVILIDDGFAIINTNKKLNEGSVYNFKDYIKYIFAKGGYDFKSKKEIIYFSIFDKYLDAQKVYTNYFNSLIDEQEWIDENSIYWLGSAIVEDKIVKEEYYFEKIGECLNTIRDDREVIYFPHRRENKDKLQGIVDRFGLKIKNPNLPIELYVLESKIRPEIVISFFSTALYSLNRILASTDVYYISIDEKELLRRNKEIDEIYRILDKEVKKFTKEVL